MNAARRRSTGSALAALSLACAHDYRDPDPANGPTALVVIANASVASARSRYGRTTEGAFHLYEGAEDCTKNYLGTVRNPHPIRELLVSANRMIVFDVSLIVTEPAMEQVCKGEFGFIPGAGETYHLVVDMEWGRGCTMRLLTPDEREIPKVNWRACAPR